MAKNKDEKKLKSKVALLDAIDQMRDEYKQRPNANQELVRILEEQMAEVKKEILALTRQVFGTKAKKSRQGELYNAKDPQDSSVVQG